MIWLALNSGGSGRSQRPRKLRLPALGPALAGRMAAAVLLSRELDGLSALKACLAGPLPGSPRCWVLHWRPKMRATASPLISSGWREALAAAGLEGRRE